MPAQPICRSRLSAISIHRPMETERRTTPSAAANGPLTDVWIRSGRGTGLTCCQAADLRNVDSMLTQRSDFVLRCKES